MYETSTIKELEGVQEAYKKLRQLNGELDHDGEPEEDELEEGLVDAVGTAISKLNGSALHHAAVGVAHSIPYGGGAGSAMLSTIHHNPSVALGAAAMGATMHGARAAYKYAKKKVTGLENTEEEELLLGGDDDEVPYDPEGNIEPRLSTDLLRREENY